MRFVGLALALAFLGLILVNSIIMLLSPSTWYELPPYFAFHGSLRRKRFRTPGGELGIRALGFTLATMVLSMFVSVLGSGRAPESIRAETFNPPRDPIYTGLCLATCLAVGGCGILMMFRPTWWLEKYVTGPGAPSRNRRRVPLELAIRLLSLLLLGPAGYVAWKCLEAIGR